MEVMLHVEERGQCDCTTVENRGQEVDNIAEQHNDGHESLGRTVIAQFQEVGNRGKTVSEIDGKQPFGDNQHRQHGGNSPSDNRKVIDVYRFVFANKLVGAEIGQQQRSTHKSNTVVAVCEEQSLQCFGIGELGFV